MALLAGGTDLLGEMKDSTAAPERLVTIRHLKELQGIRAARGGLTIGAATLLADIVESAAVQQQAPLLAMAAGKVGTPQIRNMGTIGGNLCQRPRCWYYRNNYPCFKHGGNTCFSAVGRERLPRHPRGRALVHRASLRHRAGAGRAGRDRADLDERRASARCRSRSSS